MSEEKTNSANAQASEGQTATKPPLCERYPGCIFFNSKMANMPDTAEATKDQFCRGDFPACARYILQSIWKIKAPDDMFPYQMARAQAILDATVIDQKAAPVSSATLDTANRTIKLLINALGHGFMMFNRDGLCLPTLSKACEILLEIQPVGKHISEVLHLDEKQTATMKTALKLVFNQTHAMSFSEIMHFAPQTYKHSSGSIVKLVYKPERLANGALDRIVVIATDITQQVHEQEQARERDALFASLEQIFRDKAFFGSYVRRLNDVLLVLQGHGSNMTRETLQREIHTLKGDAGLFKLDKIVSCLHDLETRIGPCADSKPNQSLSPQGECFEMIHDVRDRLEQEVRGLSAYLNNLLGMDITKIEEERSFDKNTLYAFANKLVQAGQMALYNEFLQTVCADSLHAQLRRYDAVLVDLANRFNKKIKPLCFASEDVPVLADRYKQMLDSFVHLFRNMIDHGIERPDDRQEEGKCPEGLVTIRTFLSHEKLLGQRLHLEIEDDGAGVDVARVRQKLIAKQPGGPWASASTEEILEALLTQNVSSRDNVTLYSGRGLGVSAVNAKVKALGGMMKITTKPKQGTCISIDVPYLLEPVRHGNYDLGAN